MSNKFRKLTINNTINNRRRKSEKGKLEGQELQFFLSTSDNRLQRVKSGARLFSVIRNKEINQKPIELIEHVIKRQSIQDQKLSIQEKKEKEEELNQLLNGDIDMAQYLNQIKFDPCLEILKEKNIQNFFKQKYNILMMYLEDDTKLPKDKFFENQRKSVNIAVSPPSDNHKYKESNQPLSGFISAQDKVKAIEDEVSRELESDYERQEKTRKDQEEIDQNIKEFYERMLRKYSHLFIFRAK